MLQKLLCFLGWHRFDYRFFQIDNSTGEWYMKHMCGYCPKEQIERGVIPLKGESSGDEVVRK